MVVLDGGDGGAGWGGGALGLGLGLLLVEALLVVVLLFHKGELAVVVLEGGFRVGGSREEVLDVGGGWRGWGEVGGGFCGGEGGSGRGGDGVVVVVVLRYRGVCTGSSYSC